VISVEAIDALLPQTQCGKCGYDGCLPYAQKIAQGEAINKCPPGGEQTVQKLANLLNVAYLPLQEAAQLPQVAFIKADECIGCAKCLAVCPTDAIVGANKLLHVVINDVCSGCELCLAPCPVDCIELKPLTNPLPLLARAQIFRHRFALHQKRRKRLQQAKKSKINLPPSISNAKKAASSNTNNALTRRLAQLEVALTKTHKQQQIYGDAKVSKQLHVLQQEITKLKQQLALI